MSFNHDLSLLNFREKEVIVLGASAGGIRALKKIVKRMPGDLPFLMAGVLHISNDYLEGSACAIDEEGALVKEACDKTQPERGILYLAPPGYHLLLEPDGSLSLDVSPQVNYSRPSIDVLFESAAAAFGEKVIALLLTGAGRDGAEGLAQVKMAGGFTVAQDPQDAEFDIMPKLAIARLKPDMILKLEDVPEFLAQAGLAKRGRLR